MVECFDDDTPGGVTVRVIREENTVWEPQSNGQWVGPFFRPLNEVGWKHRERRRSKECGSLRSVDRIRLTSDARPVRTRGWHDRTAAHLGEGSRPPLHAQPARRTVLSRLPWMRIPND